MISFWQQLVSRFNSIKISTERSFDHTYRRVIGVPTLRHSEITPDLFLGGQYTNRGFAILRQRGITGIVSMRMRAHKDLPDMGNVKFLHLPTIDMTAPTMADLKKGVKFIEKELKNDGKVYIHCAAGEGRGPSMVAAYLMSTGLTLEDALNQIKKVRGFIRPNAEQIARLKEFEQANYAGKIDKV